jgi:hypothetical protein
MVMASNIDDSKTISLITEDGSMDRRGNPAVKAKTGKWKSSILLLGKKTLKIMLSFGQTSMNKLDREFDLCS